MIIKLLVLDVSRAHFHPPAVREVYITLPPEDFEPGMVGKLLRTIYGTRDGGMSSSTLPLKIWGSNQEKVAPAFINIKVHCLLLGVMETMC